MGTLRSRTWILGSIALVLGATACAPREVLFPAVGLEAPALRDFPADYTPPVSYETNRPMVGFGGGGGGVTRTPLIFVHGNTVSARYWLPDRGFFEKSGWTRDELWAPGYGWDNVRYFDSADLSVPSLDRAVTSVMQYLSQKSGRPIRQVDIVGHSLGVTLVRQWMMQTNSWHKVRSFIGACGANQGVWTAWPDPRGAQRGVSWELAPGSPWLAQLSRGGDTPGPTRYMTLYDGTGWGDSLFPKPYENASALKGAYNLAFNREHHTWYDHLELPRQPDTMEAMVQWLRQAHEPLPQAQPPTLVRSGGRVSADQADARVHCASGVFYPNAQSAALEHVDFNAGELYTCYAHNPATGLSSPMARYRYQPDYVPGSDITVSASPPPGVYEQAQSITLTASDPAAFIVYTTSGTAPDSGSPLYSQPVFVPGPLTLQAVAITPDGRTSVPVSLAYDISLELVEADHTLQRQFDAAAPVQYAGKRKKGR